MISNRNVYIYIYIHIYINMKENWYKLDGPMIISVFGGWKNSGCWFVPYRTKNVKRSTEINFIQFSVNIYNKISLVRDLYLHVRNVCYSRN
jgi:hypothetical protein